MYKRSDPSLSVMPSFFQFSSYPRVITRSLKIIKQSALRYSRPVKSIPILIEERREQRKKRKRRNIVSYAISVITVHLFLRSDFRLFRTRPIESDDNICRQGNTFFFTEDHVRIENTIINTKREPSSVIRHCRRGSGGGQSVGNARDAVFFSQEIIHFPLLVRYIRMCSRVLHV